MQKKERKKMTSSYYRISNNAQGYASVHAT